MADATGSAGHAEVRYELDLADHVHECQHGRRLYPQRWLMIDRQRLSGPAERLVLRQRHDDFKLADRTHTGFSLSRHITMYIGCITISFASLTVYRCLTFEYNAQRQS